MNEARMLLSIVKMLGNENCTADDTLGRGLIE